MVLRGNSGSGKTTLAAAVQRQLGRGTANVGQDHLRRVVLREHDVAEGDNIGLIDHTVRHCLSIGYNVILEGILISDHYAPMICGLLTDHDGPSHVVYLDVPLEETLRRHDGRSQRAEVAPANLVEWFVESDYLATPDEVVIDNAELSLEETLRRLIDVVGPVSPRIDLSPARFI